MFLRSRTNGSLCRIEAPAEPITAAQPAVAESATAESAPLVYI